MEHQNYGYVGDVSLLAALPSSASLRWVGLAFLGALRRGFIGRGPSHRWGA
jgi:hypothetical protein